MKPLYLVRYCFALAVLAANIPAVEAQETPAPAGAQTPQITPPPAPILTLPDSDEPEVLLDELIRRARENSPRLEISRQHVEASKQRANATGSLLGPTLQVVPGFTGNREARDEEVILAQPLDIFGLRRAQTGVANAETRRAEAEGQLAERTLIVEIKNAAAHLFAAQEAEKLERTQVEIAGLFRDAAAKRAALGDVPPVQVQRAELELLRIQNDLSNATALRQSRRSALNLLIGEAPNTPLRVALPIDAQALAPLQSSLDSVNPAETSTATATVLAPDTTVSTTRPDILSAQASLEARQAQVKALHRETLPAVELQARRSSFFGREGSYALRAVVTVPLFDLGANKGQRRAAEAEAKAQEATIKLLNQQATSQVETARAQLASRREAIARYQNQLLPLTLDLLLKTQIGYAQGASTYLEVLEAQRTLRQLQTEYLQALVGIQMQENALDAALYGGVVPTENTNEISAPKGVIR